jgi:hypothetical protein
MWLSGDMAGHGARPATTRLSRFFRAPRRAHPGSVNRGRQLRARVSARGVLWLCRGLCVLRLSLSRPARFISRLAFAGDGWWAMMVDNSSQRPSTRTPAADGEEQDRLDCRWLDGRRPGSCRDSGRPPVHPGQRERAHRCCPARVRVGMGVVDRAVGPGSPTSPNDGRLRRSRSWR